MHTVIESFMKRTGRVKMRKMELYRTTLKNIAELQLKVCTQKDRFLVGQGDYLVRVNEKMAGLRDDADKAKTFWEKVQFVMSKKQSGEEISILNDLIRKTQDYMNVIHEIEACEEKIKALIIKAELLEEQAIAQEKLTYINTILYVNSMTVEQKVNQMIVADNTDTLNKITPERQQLLTKCLAFVKDLLKEADPTFLNNLAKDLYESIKELDNMDEIEKDDIVTQMSSIILNSLTIVLMETNKAITKKIDNTESIYYYEEIFAATGWIREYDMNEHVDMNGIIDDTVPIHQIIVTEIANRLEELKMSYKVTKSTLDSMAYGELKDMYILEENEFRRRYDRKLDMDRAKKCINFNSGTHIKSIIPESSSHEMSMA